MDAKRFEKAHTRALACWKPLVPPPVALETPSSFHEPTTVVTDRHFDHSASTLWKKSSEKKRKTTNCFASPLLQGEIEVELMDIDDCTPVREVRKVGWLNLEPVDAPAISEFDLDNIDNLWYHQLDYGTFLR